MNWLKVLVKNLVKKLSKTVEKPSIIVGSEFASSELFDANLCPMYPM
jgi:hypothetical protein